MTKKWLFIIFGSLLLQPLAFADVSYQETTQITGGSLQGMLKLAGAFSSQAKQANAPVTSTVALHGNRMVRSTPHTTEIIDALDKKPAIVGHSTGGLLAQMLAGRGLSAATVAIDPGVFRGVLPLPASVLRGVGPFLVNPLTRGRAITLTFDQFKYGWANALDEKEAGEGEDDEPRPRSPPDHRRR